MIEQDDGLQNLFLDESISVTLRRRDWIVLSVLWIARAGVAEYNQAMLDIAILNVNVPKFKACLSSCDYTVDPEHKCHRERVEISKILHPFIDLNESES